MERVPLVRQHGLSIDQRLIVVLVVQGCSRWSTPANRKVRLNAPNVVVLLASVDEEAFKLAFAHAWLTVLHDGYVRLRCDLARPSQSQEFLIVFDSAGLAEDVVQLIIVATLVCQVGLLGDLSLQL